MQPDDVDLAVRAAAEGADVVLEGGEAVVPGKKGFYVKLALLSGSQVLLSVSQAPLGKPCAAITGRDLEPSPSWSPTGRHRCPREVRRARPEAPVGSPQRRCYSPRGVPPSSVREAVFAFFGLH